MEEWEDMRKELFTMNANNALQLYQYIFNEPYAHLDINTKKSEYFKNFNKLEIEENNNK